MIKLGSKVTDRITGFTGTVTGYVEYISGCNQCLVVPRVKDDGSQIDSCWYDEQRLVVDESVPVLQLDNGKTPGPDKAAPKR